MSTTATRVRRKPAPVPMTAAQVQEWHAEREAEFALEDYLEMQPEPARPDRPPAGRYVQVHIGRWIPYNPTLRAALRAAFGRQVSVNATILFAHLEWRFSKTRGSPFWKSYGPSRVREEHDARVGDGQLRRACRALSSTQPSCKSA